MRPRSVLAFLILPLLLACHGEEKKADSAASPVIGEDGRYDCHDDAIRPDEGAQMAWLSRGFHLTNLNTKSFQEGDFEFRLISREPGSYEQLLLISREQGKVSARIVRPESELHRDFMAHCERSGSVLPDSWEPVTPLDTLSLDDSFAVRAVALLETRRAAGFPDTRRCDSATGIPSPLSAAIYVIDMKSARLRQTSVLRPGHYAETFWNDLQKLFESPAVKNPGPGF